ncbi:hypothetical protein LMG27198_33600 [Methylocystis echinoides]|uniref:Uncharacterized protein n=1 Tax=Methylocystis echinoides TaxID=29468 RepID=A0A9W6GWT1_9HYPH|nr:hypothetical protein LMG27198_33600 [Methylocystis echinoides]
MLATQTSPCPAASHKLYFLKCSVHMQRRIFPDRVKLWREWRVGFIGRRGMGARRFPVAQ